MERRASTRTPREPPTQGPPELSHEEKREIARKAGMLIINKTFANVDALLNVPEYACVSRRLIYRELSALKEIDGIAAIAKAFSDGEYPACTGRVVEPAALAAAPTTAPADLTLPLAERRTLWMKMATLQLKADRASGALAVGKKGLVDG